MQSVWKSGNKNKLILFFSGWGMNEQVTEHLDSGDWDVCTCFGYDDLTTRDADRWKTYGTIDVIAWSMGVWAAERIVEKYMIPYNKAIAINGTPIPADDRWGIPSAIAWGTHDNLTPANLRKFYRRVFGNVEVTDHLIGKLAGIDPGKIKTELFHILSTADNMNIIRWNKAIISGDDRIFPPGNMMNYWDGRCEVKKINAPHYPFHLVLNWKEVVDEWGGE